VWPLLPLQALLLAVAPGGDGTHWAYRAPVAPTLPAEAFPGWARSPLDLFVGARFAAEGLRPAPEASRATLLRRASLDLTGLPPTPEELAAFLADPAPDAYERALERLFASPHYGEHQARAWLDLARYADTRGYEKDARREMWRYREQVIEAFQQDVPFDRFTAEQLAGDLLPGATVEQLVASGFHRNTLVNEEGGTDPEEFRVAAVKDRVNTTALVWLGTTLECAQCHDHKYDPFTQEDYYRFYAFFDSTEDSGNSDEPSLEAPGEAWRARMAPLVAERDELKRRFEALSSSGAFEGWRVAWQAFPPSAPLVPASVSTSSGVTFAPLPDGSWLAHGEPAGSDDYVLTAELAPGALHGFALDVLPDASLPGRGPGRNEHGNFVLNELELRLDGVPVALAPARADHEQDGYPAHAATDGDPHSGWAIGGASEEAHVLYVPLGEARTLAAPARLELTLRQQYGSGHVLGRWRVGRLSEPVPAADPVPGPALVPELAQDTPALRETYARGFARHARELAPARVRLAKLEQELAPPRALVMKERAEPRRTFVHGRGNFLAPGKEVEPGVPAVLPPLAATGVRPTRLDLARWLTAPENPLSARVVVNRLWQRVFGAGLVETENDFGTRGERPSHPELLDWLALEFRARGQSQREFLRLVLTSATYRQDSGGAPEAWARDPQNRLLARGPKLRLEAEMVRDVALAASGLLAREVGGPSVFPPQPEGIWQSPYSGERWPTSQGKDAHRRGLYTFLKRSAPYPTFLLFDATSRELACSRRQRSNTPLQALATLDDPAFVECAQALGARLAQAGSLEAGVRLGFVLCTAREPAPEELALLAELFEARRADYALRPEDVHLRAGEGATPELAAWCALATVLLNLDETLTKS